MGHKIMNMLFMGIDIGTSGMRVEVNNLKGEVLASSDNQYKSTYPRVGWCEQNPNDWIKALKENIKDCVEQLGCNSKNIVSIAVCATSCTCIPVDNEGNTLSNAIMWMDNRASKEVEDINKTNHKILKYCGNAVAVEWLTPKILWYKNNENDLYNKSYKIIEQLDFINFQLTRKFVASKCNATCKANYVDGIGFDNGFFNSIGLDDYKDKMITQVISTGEVIDYIDESFADEMGLSRNIKIIQGGIDAHIASYALGVVKPGVMGMITGTSFVHLSLTELNQKIDGIWGPYYNPTVQGLWLLEGGQVSAGSLVRWFIENFDSKAEKPYESLGAASEKIEPGAEGLITLDFFQGNRTPYKDSQAKGVIFGLTLKHSSAHIYKSILEAVAYGTNNIIVNYENQGVKTEKLVACGGVTKDKRWMQIIADVTGKEIEITNNAQSGVLGCCILGSVAMGGYNSYEEAVKNMITISDVFLPDMDNYNIYKRYFKKYLDIYDRLKDVM